MGGVLKFQGLDVYQAAIQFGARSVEIGRRTPRGHFELRDQLMRAATSITLNIAEGCGRTSTADAIRFYVIARGSTYECAAVLDVMRMLGLVAPEDHSACMLLLERLASMLTRLAQIRAR